MTKREALLKSAVQMGRHLGASTELQNEVLAKMSNNNISHVLTNDRLIVALGNATMKKNLKNETRRGSYASCKMRLAARVLMKAREIGGVEDANVSWCDLLVPEKFQPVATAVCLVSGCTGNMVEHPSNARKSGYYIKDMAGTKETEAIMVRDIKKADDARLFTAICKKKWVTEVSALGCAALNEHTFNKVIDLPKPADLGTLSRYLRNAARDIATIDNEEQYRHAVHIVQARLLSYNRRRPGELQTIK